MARARLGSNVKKGLKFFIYGKHGTRKSNTAVDFMKMTNEEGKPLKVLFIDCETGSVDGFGLERLESEGVDIRNICIVYTSELSEVRDYSDRFVNEEPYYEIDEDGCETDEMILDADGNQFIADAIVIDGITVIADNINDAAINLSEKRASVKAKLQNKTVEEAEVMVGTAGLEFKDFNKIKSTGKTLIRKLITATDKYVAITGRAKDKKEMKRDDKGNMVLTSLGYEVPEAWEFIQYEVFTILHNMFDEDGEVYAVVENKDRTGKFKQNEIIKNPSVSLWQSIIDKNKGKERNIGMSQDASEKANKSNEDSFKEIIGYTDNTSNSKATKTTPKTVVEELTAKDWIEKINSLKASLSAVKRRAMKPKLENEGLPTTFTEDIEVSVLQQVYDVMSS